MNLILETTTGRLVPAGVVPQLARGPVAASLQFVTNGAAALRAGGAPIALRLYTPDDLVTAKATFAAWVANPAALLYQATLDILAGNLAWVQQPTLFGKVSYDDPNVDSQLFHLSFSGAPNGQSAGTQIVITQPTGPVNYVQDLGTFGGQLAVQTEGFWRVKAPGNMLGLQLNAQAAPTGANVIVEVYKGGVATGKTATLTAAAKFEETIFGSPLALAIGDVIQFRPTQVGSGAKGSNLNVKAIIQLS